MELKIILALLIVSVIVTCEGAQIVINADDDTDGYIEIKLNKDPSKIFTSSSMLPIQIINVTETPKIIEPPSSSIIVDLPQLNDTTADPSETKWVLHNPQSNSNPNSNLNPNPISNSDPFRTTGFKPTELEYGLEGVVDPSLMWVKGKTESFLMSQSEGPTEIYELYPGSPIPHHKRPTKIQQSGPMKFFSSMFRPKSPKPWKRPPPPWARKSKPKQRRTRPNSGLPPMPLRNPKRPPPLPTHESTIRRGGSGRTPPEVVEFCLMNSERCSWSDQDQRLFMMDDEFSKWDSLPSKDTPPTLMHFCMRNSVHCHWSERDKRWYLIDMVQKVSE